MTKIQQAHDLSEQWHIKNPTLLNGELGIESDTNRIKVGNGIDDWNNLQYITDKDWNVVDINSSKYIANKPFEKKEAFSIDDVSIYANDSYCTESNTRYEIFPGKTYVLTVGDDKSYLTAYSVTNSGEELPYVCMGMCTEILQYIGVQDFDDIPSHGIYGVCYEKDWSDLYIYSSVEVNNVTVKIEELRKLNSDYTEHGLHTYSNSNAIHYGDNITTIDGVSGAIVGENVLTTGSNVFVLGKDVKTLAPNDAIVGMNITATAPNCAIVGKDINAVSSVALGVNINVGYSATAVGYNIIAQGWVAIGNNVNCAYGSIAIGNNICYNQSIGSSMIIGNSIGGKSAYKIYAFGNYINIGSYSVAYGADINSGNYDNLLGSQLNVSNVSTSTILGYTIDSNSDKSISDCVALGRGLVLNSNNQTIIGMYNLPDDDDVYAFILGDGTYGSRKNIFTVDHNGSAYFDGSVSINSSFEIINNNTLTTKEYVDNAVSHASADTSNLVTLSDFNDYTNSVTNDFANRVTVTNFNSYSNNMNNTVANLVTVSNFNNYSNTMNNTVANLVTVSNFNNYSNTMNNIVVNLATYSFVNDAINNVSIDVFDSGDIFSRFSLVG